jgi:hypothetical protein
VTALPFDSHLAEHWRRRLPAALVRVVLPAAFLALAVVTVVLDYSVGTGPFTAADRAGWHPALVSAQFGSVLATLVLVPVHFRWAAWTGAASAAWVCADGPASPSPLWWAAASLCWLVAGCATWLEDARQRAVARQDATLVVPDVDEATRRALGRPRVVGVVVAGAGLLVAVGFAVLYVHDVRAVESFRSSALVGTGTVTKLDGDDFSFFVDVDGRSVRVPEVILSPAVGDQVQIAYAADGSRAERTDDVFDPTGAIVMLIPGLLLALAASGREIARLRAGSRLLRDGGPAWRVAVGPTSDALLDVAPLDAPREVVAQLRLGRLWAIPDEADVSADSRPVSAVPDEELLDWMRSLRDEGAGVDGGQVHVEPDDQALVVGLERVGDWPLVRVDGGWWMSDAPARQPWSWSWRARPEAAAAPRRSGRAVELHKSDSEGAGASRLARSGARDATDRRQGWTGFWSGVDTHVFRLARRTPLAVPFLAAPVAGLATSWLFAPPDGGGWLFAVVAAFGAASLGAGWLDSARPRLRTSDQGLMMAGPILDGTVPWSEVHGAVADDDGLVVRFADDAVAFPYVPGASAPLLPGDPAPHVAADLVLGARARAAGSRTAGVRRTISPAAVVGALWAASVFIGAIVANL